MSNKKKMIVIFIIVLIIAMIAIGLFFIKTKISDKYYEIEKIERYNYFVLKEENNYGVINTKGDIILDSEYEKIVIPNPTKDLFVCYENDNPIILNSNKEQILSEYEKIEPIKLKNIASDLAYEKSALIYKSGDKYGIIDFKGNTLTKPIYESIESISYREGELLVKKDGKYGVININGYVMIKPEYDDIISDDYYDEENEHKLSGYIVGIKYEDGMKYGYINYKGKLELKEQYNEISRVTNIKDKNSVYLIARKDGQFGVLKNGKEILQYEYQSIEYDDKNNIFILEKTKKYGVSNLNGDIIIPIDNTSIELKGIYIYAINGQNKYVYDKNGQIVDIDFNKVIIDTTNQNYKITLNINNDKSLYGVIDLNNKQIIDEKYLYIEYAYDNYFIACGENGKLGVIDDKGNIIVELNYDVVEKLQDKNIIQAVNSQNNITEIYSSNLEKVSEMKNAVIQNQKDYIKIYSDNELVYLDNNGNIVQNTNILNNKLFAKKENETWGFVDKENQIKVNAQYERVTDFNQYGYAAIRKDNKWGSINQDGEIIIEPIYEFSSNSEPDFIGKYYKVQYEFGEIYYTSNTNK